MSARVQRRRFKGAGVCAAALVAFAGGCTATPATVAGSAAGTSKAPPSPREVLAGAVPGDSSQPFAFAITGVDGLTVTGVVDPAGRGYRLASADKDAELGFTLSMTFLVLDGQAWMKAAFTGTEGLAGLPKLPKKWMLLDPAKITDKENVPLAYEDGADPANAGVLMESIVDVQQTAPGTFAGTVDLTQRPEAEFADPQQLTALGKKAGAVPFVAKVDAKGRLTSAVVTIPAAGRAKAGTYALSYSDYGTDDLPAKPAADAQQKAPAVAYEMLNG